MPTRRQEKMARVVKEVVSDAIANHLSDPRIEGFVSVTRVEVAADLRSADVYLGSKLKSKFCPVLQFHQDEQFKKTLETMKLIDQAVSELKEKNTVEQEQD
jgi:ribosome-binding factor A